MRIYYSELCLIGGKVERNVDRLIANGADSIELMLDGAGWDGFHLRMTELASSLASKGVAYSVHVPVWDANLTSESSHVRAAVEESYRGTIEFAAMIGARHVVLHPGYCSDPHFSRETARRRAHKAVERLAEFNSDYGQLLLVENVGSPSASVLSEREYVHFLDGFPESVGYIVDVGHAFISGWSLDTLLPALKDRLHALHLHDNDGSVDSHAPLGDGSIDWNSVLAAAAATGRDLGLVLEFNIGTGLERLAESRAFLEEALSPGADAGSGYAWNASPVLAARL
jgi:sugar phosphate isomerase/epimerase